MESYDIIEMCEYICKTSRKFGVYAICHELSVSDNTIDVSELDRKLTVFNTYEDMENCYEKIAPLAEYACCFTPDEECIDENT